MYIKCFINGSWKENCYILCYSSNAIIFDPGDCYQPIVDFLCSNNLTPVAILNTHAHFDHITSVYELQQKYNIPFYLHSNDKKLLNTANLYMKLFGGSNIIKIPKVDYYLDEVSNLVFNGININILFTPGHTDGSICFSYNNILFTGDTLLKGKIGRVDLPGGNLDKLISSLKKISLLPKNTLIYPGHGEITLLKNELLFNKQLQYYIR
jgi:hydroxyacylglutathione hydrolase